MRSAIMIALTAAYFAVAFSSYNQVSAGPELQAATPCTAVTASGSAGPALASDCTVTAAR